MTSRKAAGNELFPSSRRPSARTSRWPPLYMQIVLGMVLGAVTGIVFGRAASWLGEAGQIVIRLIKTLAAPLLFLAVLDALGRSEMRAKAGAWMVGVSAINASFALLIGLSISNVLRPGEHIALPARSGGSPESHEGIDFGRSLAGYIPENILEPFLESSIISLVLMALLFGLALRKAKNEQLVLGTKTYVAIEEGIRFLFRTNEIALGWIVRLVPLAVFGVVARTVGEQGFAPVVGLAIYVGVAILGLSLQVLVVYQLWVKFVARRKLREFWLGARDPVVYAMGASSSLATLPVTLASLAKMHVSEQSARLSACIGTNLNNDGILLYEAMAVLFVAQAHGIRMTLGQQLVAALASVLAGVGIAGVPEAGLVSLSLVLATVGLPLEILPLLLTVDWILSRARAMTNVVSDLVVATVLDRVAPPPSEDGGASRSLTPRS